MVFYFTATGNSLYVAKQLEPHPVSIAQAVHDSEKVYRAERIGIVCPVFGHEMPQLVKDFLKEYRFETDYFYILLTYGRYHGGASELAEHFVRPLGIRPAYINVILMVDNFLPVFDMDEERKLDKKVEEQLEKIKGDIEGKVRFISPVTEEDRSIHQFYLDLAAKEPPDSRFHLYQITDQCIGCGICQKVCPKGCFHLEGQKSVWNPEGCLGCMACIHACPMLAIHLTQPEPNPKARYRNENISICEIIDANNQMK